MEKITVRVLSGKDLNKGTVLNAMIHQDDIKRLRGKIKSFTPQLLLAQGENLFEYSVWGFSSKRNSLYAEIDHWTGSMKYSREAIAGLVYIAFLEGRKRVQTVNSPILRGSSILEGFFLPEGLYPFYDEGTFKEADHWAYLIDQGLPDFPDVEFDLVVTPKMKEIRKVNYDLYGTGLDHQHSVNGKTFSDFLKEKIEEILLLPNVHVREVGWDGVREYQEGC